MKVVLFNGPPRSGKDTAAQYALHYLNNGMLGNIGIFYRFASPLKRAVHEMFGFKNVEDEHFSITKEIPSSALGGMSPRQAYIWFSEEVVKPKFGQDFWAKIAVNAIRRAASLHKGNDLCPTIVISDCGFQPEVDVLITELGPKNVWVARIHRPGMDYEGDSRGYVMNNHKPENAVDIANNGSLSQFEDKIIRFIRKVEDAK